MIVLDRTPIYLGLLAATALIFALAAHDPIAVAALTALAGAAALTAVRLRYGWAAIRARQTGQHGRQTHIRERRDRFVAGALTMAQRTWLVLFVLLLVAHGLRAAFADHMLFERQRLCAELAIAAHSPLSSARRISCRGADRLLLEVRR